jgi:hypothetical protein
LKYFLKISEYAVGLPDKNNISEVPTVSDAIWNMSIQTHSAKRAGKHLDLRMSNPKTGPAYSWAVRHWPEPGEKRLAIRQPDHTRDYMRWEGDIPSGYGAGEVALKNYGKITVETSSPNKINFSTGDERYTLLKTKDNRWLIINKVQNT